MTTIYVSHAQLEDTMVRKRRVDGEVQIGHYFWSDTSNNNSNNNSDNDDDNDNDDDDDDDADNNNNSIYLYTVCKSS